MFLYRANYGPTPEGPKYGAFRRVWQRGRIVCGELDEELVRFVTEDELFQAKEPDGK